MSLQEEMFWNIIRINIRYYRNKKKLAQEELAEKCNLSHYYIKRDRKFKKKQNI